MTQWEEQARRLVFEYAACRTEAERITYVEALGDRCLDLAVLEEVLRLAAIGAVALGTKQVDV